MFVSSPIQSLLTHIFVHSTYNKYLLD